MAARACQMENNFRWAATLFYKDSIAGVIHPKVKLKMKNDSLFHELSRNVNKKIA